MDLAGGLPLLCSGQRTKDGAGVDASLLLDLGRHAAADDGVRCRKVAAGEPLMALRAVLI